jgi:predicted AAA+ superfamily ATPase
MKKRYLESQVIEDVERKMVFVGGPKQTGKTTLSKRLLGKGLGILIGTLQKIEKKS